MVLLILALALVGISWRRIFPVSTRGKTIITVWAPRWLATSEYLRDNLDGYQAAHPRVLVQLRPARPADFDRLERAWRSGRKCGDLVLAPSTRARRWARDGLLTEWQGFFDMQLPADGFIPGFLRSGQVAGKQYLIPLLGHPTLVAVAAKAPAYRGLAAAGGRLGVDQAALAQAGPAVALATGQTEAKAIAWCREREANHKDAPYLLTVYPGPRALRRQHRLTWAAPQPGRPTVAETEGLVIPRCNAHYRICEYLARNYLMDRRLYSEGEWRYGLPTIEAYYRQAGKHHPGPLLAAVEQSVPLP